MQKTFGLVLCFITLLYPCAILAQLPANPWETPAQPAAAVTINNTQTTSNNDVSYNTPTTSVALRQAPVSNSSTSNGWRGSGQFSRLGYTGDVTTYDKAQGQEMLAPEVNNTNMNIMIQHLRNLGYTIPASYDNGFSNFLQDYTTELQNAYSGLGRQNNPFDTMFNSMIDAFEHFTNLDVGNLMFNSLNLIQRE